MRWWLLGILIGSLWCSGTAEAATPAVTLLTLDDRPVNTIFVQQLAAIAGITLTISNDPAAAATADLVSLNTAVSGSLVASRSADPVGLVPPPLRPDALVHFAVPRVQPLVKDEATLAAYTTAIASLKNTTTQEAVRAAIAGEGPLPVDPQLADYAHRMRGWLDFLDRANIPPDRLLITLDDNRPGPLAAWLKLECGRFSRHVQDGTDEGMMLLLARWCREHQSRPRPVECGLLWTDPAALLGIQPFESGMPVENLLRMTDWLHLRLTSQLEVTEPWRPVLWLHGPGGSPAAIRETGRTLGTHPVVVADFAALNMGDQELFATWSTDGVPAGIRGYVGWNTTSNTLGTAIALWAALDYGYAERADPETVGAAVELFLWSRILDEYLFGAEVRPGRQLTLREAGQPTQGLTPEQVRAEAEWLQFALLERWGTLAPAWQAVFQDLDPGGATSASITIPWARLFEIGVCPVDPRGFLPTIRPAPLPPSPR